MFDFSRKINDSSLDSKDTDFHFEDSPVDQSNPSLNQGYSLKNIDRTNDLKSESTNQFSIDELEGIPDPSVSNLLFQDEATQNLTDSSIVSNETSNNIIELGKLRYKPNNNKTSINTTESSSNSNEVNQKDSELLNELGDLPTERETQEFQIDISYNSLKLQNKDLHFQNKMVESFESFSKSLNLQKPYPLQFINRRINKRILHDFIEYRNFQSKIALRRKRNFSNTIIRHNYPTRFWRSFARLDL